MNATITFKGKVRNGRIEIPTLKRSHCAMREFRSHPVYGVIANSDLFPNVLTRIKRDLLGHRYALDLAALPENVTVDASGFLATVIIKV